jgi:hypothetical protein
MYYLTSTLQAKSEELFLAASFRSKCGFEVARDRAPARAESQVSESRPAAPKFVDDKTWAPAIARVVIEINFGEWS